MIALRTDDDREPEVPQRAHGSQTSAIDVDTSICGWGGAAAADGGLDEGRLAEGFLTCRTG